MHMLSFNIFSNRHHTWYILGSPFFICIYHGWRVSDDTHNISLKTLNFGFIHKKKTIWAKNIRPSLYAHISIRCYHLKIIQYYECSSEIPTGNTQKYRGKYIYSINLKCSPKHKTYNLLYVFVYVSHIQWMV